MNPPTDEEVIRDLRLQLAFALQELERYRIQVYAAYEALGVSLPCDTGLARLIEERLGETK